MNAYANKYLISNNFWYRISGLFLENDSISIVFAKKIMCIHFDAKF